MEWAPSSMAVIERGNMSRIPRELLALPHWVGWRLQQRDGKPTKVPVDPKSGHYADTTDRGTWSEDARRTDTVCAEIGGARR